MSITQRIDLDDAAVQAALAEAVTLGQDMTPLFDEIGASVVTSVELRFEQGLAPDGTPWLPSHRARDSGGQTLIDTRRLLGSLSHQPDAQGVDIGFNAIYAAVHHYGATIEARNAKALAFPGAGGETVFRKKVAIPARPLIGAEDFDAEEIAEITADFVSEIFGGRA